jgi:hypothetical protein
MISSSNNSTRTRAMAVVGTILVIIFTGVITAFGGMKPGVGKTMLIMAIAIVSHMSGWHYCRANTEQKQEAEDQATISQRLKDNTQTARQHDGV